MTSLTSDIIVDAPADRVWEVVAHRFDRIGEWATAILASTAHAIAASQAGAPVAGRVCHTGVRAVPRVTETIVAYDEGGRTLTYEASAGMPAFVTVARSTWRVTALDDGRSQVAFYAQIEVRGLLGRLGRWWLLTQVGRAGRHLLQDLKHYVEHGSASPRKQRQRPPVAIPARDASSIGEGMDPVAAIGRWPTTRRLRAALRANAVFSIVCGLALLALGWFIADPWGLGPAAVPPLVGAGVAGFGTLLAWLSVAPARPLRLWAATVVAADVLWVAGSVVLLATHRPHRQGEVAIAAVATVVAVLAAWQVAGRAAMRGDDPFADIEVVESARVLAVGPEQVWPLLTDHQLYGRLAPNLSGVEVISDPGQPLRRRCTSTTGQHWEETCTLWQDGRRFAVEVDTTHYPYPITMMRGLWRVDPHPHGSLVVMRFAYRATPSIRGGIFAIVLYWLAPLALRRIFDGWQRQLPHAPTVARQIEVRP